MTYLFLDIDGVLHPVSAAGKFFRYENISLLWNVIKNEDIQIVITSTWRLDKTLEELKILLGVLLQEAISHPTMLGPLSAENRLQRISLKKAKPPDEAIYSGGHCIFHLYSAMHADSK